MTKKPEQAKKVVFTFQKSEDYRVFPVNGVWGGVTPRGDLKLDFFVESHLPDSVEHSVTPLGLGPEVQRKPGDRSTTHLTRDVQLGLLISLEHAESIANFILGKVKEARTAASSADERVQ